MGRKAGVSAEQTRTELLEAAARVFALKGYDGASITDICNEAGLSSGSIYAHYEGKADLFLDVVRQHASEEFLRLIALPVSGGGIAEFIETVGGTYARPGPPVVSELITEVIVACKRHPEVDDLVNHWLIDGEHLVGTAMKQAQSEGVIADDVSVSALSRFVLMVALGSRIAGALKLPEVDEKDWAALISRLVASVRAENG